MPDSLEEKIVSIVAAVKHVPLERVTPESTFEELGIDSLDGMNILFEVESAFDVSIPDEQAKAIRSVREMIEGVRALTAGGAGATA